jgi:hypothetical protein
MVAILVLLPSDFENKVSEFSLLAFATATSKSYTTWHRNRLRNIRTLLTVLRSLKPWRDVLSTKICKRDRIYRSVTDPPVIGFARTNRNAVIHLPSVPVAPTPDTTLAFAHPDTTGQD